MKRKSGIIQGALFEDDFLIRTLGNIARDPDYALTELVANAWDAGATDVRIRIPLELGQTIEISDNGHGMTSEQFKQRWMKLGYNREKHQGKRVEFPSGVDGGNRLAYGRNGVGRHAMLCFCDRYIVRTKRDGAASEFGVRPSSGEHPFVIDSAKSEKKQGHGTAIHGSVERNLPDADEIRETISARFVHDPRFRISVNGDAIALESHPGAEEPVKLLVPDCGEIEVIILDTQKSARTKQKQGFAFWVHGRLVGEPSWTLGNSTPIDARTTFGRRFTILVKSDCLEGELKPDWSGFRKGEKRNQLYDILTDFALAKYKEYSREKVDDTKRRVFEDNLTDIRTLSESGKDEIVQFVESVVEREPTISSESLSTAVQAVINLQQTKSGQHLLKTLSSLPSDDIEALDRLLAEWSVQDALTVLDEIDRRIATITAIELLSTRSDTDELHTLHPLVTDSRWLFGPEFDSNEYASNQSIKNAVNKVFRVSSSNVDYPNWRNRPDLVMLADSSLSAVGLEDIDQDNLVQTRKLLLLELKKGSSTIGRAELNQAEKYIDDIRDCGHISGAFFTDCFVIGDSIDTTVTLTKSLRGQSDIEHSRVRGICYSTLTQTASKRLFKLKERLQDRYSAASQGKRSSVLDDLLKQAPLVFA
jgi:hypothetical protein